MRELDKSSLPLITDKSFRKYGKVFDHTFPDIIEFMEEKTRIPEEGNIYIASDSKFEQVESFKYIKEQIYGGQDIQFGYCNGMNENLNALEFHKGSEVNIAVTDFVLILGKVQDIEGLEYDTNNVEAFYVRRGDVFEIYSTTLHFSPCKVSKDGFKCVVILPKFTNTDPNFKPEGLLFKNNKWILTHPENNKLMSQGVNGRLLGENIRII